MDTPDLSIIDTHLHVWNPNQLSYPWLVDVPALNKAFLPADYHQACGDHRVEQMVFVQCECDQTQYKEEAQWVTDLAAADPRIAGIVPWAPLEKGDGARGELEELASNKLIKGIRRIIQFEDDPAWCLQPNFIAGMQLLADFDFHYEICLKGPDQTQSCLELVRQCPNVRFIVDHIGKPFISEGQREPWATHIREFAAMDNVWCKMSGLVVEADMHQWTPADLQPYIDHVIESFGFDRVLFGGDWPVVLQAAALSQWIDTLKAAVAAASATEQTNLFHDNAVAFYRLGS